MFLLDLLLVIVAGAVTWMALAISIEFSPAQTSIVILATASLYAALLAAGRAGR